MSSVPQYLQKLYEIYRQHPAVTIDSRTVAEGSIFFALKGEKLDGNKFAAEALNRGAVLSVVDDPQLRNEKACFLVPDVLSALQELARFHRMRFGIPVLGITGSNGKTTTKELLAATLGTRFRLAYTAGNLNNHIGVPLTILSWKPDIEFAIVEMGANHLGEIRNLCSIAMPGYGIITNIGKAHLEGFGSLENIRKGKGELYEWLKTNGGIAFRNAREKSLQDLTFPSSRLVSYGGENDSLQVISMQAKPFLEAVIRTIDHDGREKDLYFQTNLAGGYNIENLVTAVQVAAYFGVKHDAMIEAIATYQPSNSRSQIIETGSNRLFFDAYNANPTSMMASLREFLAFPAADRTFILGDMLELGASSEEEHLKIIRFLEENEDGKVYLVGPVFSKMYHGNKFTCYSNVDQLISHLQVHMPESSFIFVKGSQGIRLEKIKECFNF